MKHHHEFQALGHWIETLGMRGVTGDPAHDLVDDREGDVEPTAADATRVPSTSPPPVPEACAERIDFDALCERAALETAARRACR